MFGSKTYELSLHRGYVSHWGMAHAVRELIQNALDSSSPFVYEFEQDGDTYSLALTSEFSTLSPQTLLLGSSSKGDSTDSIGSFGEGYKIALLVLTRLGHDVEIRNGPLLWRPRFRHNAKFNEELLVIDELPLPDRTNKGLTFVVKGLSEDDVATIRDSCLQMQSDIGEVKKTPKGDILLDREGKLYVGGLFVCDTGTKHSYSIKPEFLKLERDRQTVDGWDLHCLTRDMWFATGEHDRVAKMIDAGVTDVKYAEYHSPELVKDACYRLFVERNPGAIAVKSQEELKAYVARGLTNTVVVREPMYSNVTEAKAYRETVVVKEKTPAEYLEEWFAEYQFNTHEKAREPFRKLIERAKKWRIA